MAPEDFVAEEAALLDAGRFDDWLSLFAPDGHYWVPLLGAQQADPVSHNSLAYEARGDEQLLLAGTCRHELVRRSSSWAIRLKRVDLLNPTRALPAVQLFI